MSGLERTAVLGVEFDEEVRKALMDVLRELGAVQHAHSRGVAGSQDVEILDVHVGGKPLVVEAETYIGLSVRGETTLVDRVESMLRERLRLP